MGRRERAVNKALAAKRGQRIGSTVGTLLIVRRKHQRRLRIIRSQAVQTWDMRANTPMSSHWGWRHAEIGVVAAARTHDRLLSRDFGSHKRWRRRPQAACRVKRISVRDNGIPTPLVDRHVASARLAPRPGLRGIERSTTGRNALSGLGVAKRRGLQLRGRFRYSSSSGPPLRLWLGGCAAVRGRVLVPDVRDGLAAPLKDLLQPGLLVGGFAW